MTIELSEKPSNSENEQPAAVLLALGELKGLAQGMMDILSQQSPTLQRLESQTAEILSLAETVEESQQETQEAAELAQEAAESAEAAVTAEQNENEDGSLGENPQPVEIAVLGTEPEAIPETPPSRLASGVRKFLLG